MSSRSKPTPLRRIWERFDPFDPAEAPETGYAGQFLLWVLPVLLLFSLGTLGVAIVAHLGLAPEPLAGAPAASARTLLFPSLGFALLVAGALVLAGQGRHRASAYVAVGGASLIILVAELTVPDVDPTPVSAFMAVPLLLSSVLLPLWFTTTLATVSVLGALANPVLGGPTSSIVMPILFGALAVLAVGINRLREQEMARSKAQQEALLERETRFRALAENIEDVFWLTDPAKQEMLYISPAFEEVWGRSPAILEEDPLAWLDAVHPDDRERVAAGIPDAQVDGTYDEIFRVVQPDGQVRWVRDRAFPIKGAQGDVVRLVGIAQDITDQVRLQAQEARNAAEQARQGEMEKLVWMTSHALKTPVRTLTSFAQLALRADQDPLPPPVADGLGYVLDAAGQLDQLMTDLRLYAEILMRQGPLETVETEQVVDGVLSALLAEEAEQHAQVVLGDLPPVRGDPRQIRQLFLEGLENALLHTGSNVVIEARAEELRPGWYRFEIQDDGPGIPEGLQERAFGLFQRLDADLSEGHTGLGLPLCRQIVEGHGGTIELGSPVHDPPGASEEDAPTGTRLCFVLPGAEIDASTRGELAALGMLQRHPAGRDGLAAEALEAWEASGSVDPRDLQPSPA